MAATLRHGSIKLVICPLYHLGVVDIIHTCDVLGVDGEFKGVWQGFDPVLGIAGHFPSLLEHFEEGQEGENELDDGEDGDEKVA